MKLKNWVATDANLQFRLKLSLRLAENQIVSGGNQTWFCFYNRTKLYTYTKPSLVPLDRSYNLVSEGTAFFYFHGVDLGPLSKILAVNMGLLSPPRAFSSWLSLYLTSLSTQPISLSSPASSLMLLLFYCSLTVSMITNTVWLITLSVSFFLSLYTSLI